MLHTSNYSWKFSDRIGSGAFGYVFKVSFNECLLSVYFLRVFMHHVYTSMV